MIVCKTRYGEVEDLLLENYYDLEDKLRKLEEYDKIWELINKRLTLTVELSKL